MGDADQNSGDYAFTVVTFLTVLLSARLRKEVSAAYP